MRYFPAATPSSAFAHWAGVRELLMNAAATPACVSAPTWSFISEMSGETTTVTPGMSSAGT